MNVHTNCNVDSIYDIDCHVITKIDVLNAINKLKPDKVNEHGCLLSENFINDSDLLFYMYHYYLL